PRPVLLRRPELSGRPRLRPDQRPRGHRPARLVPGRLRRGRGRGAGLPRPTGRRDRRGRRLSGASPPPRRTSRRSGPPMTPLVTPEDPAAWPADLLPPPFAGGDRPGLLDVIPPLLEHPAPGRDLVVLLDGVG